jgi:hypothetical protein
MAGYTLAQAETKLEQYLAAEEAVLTGQSFEIDTGGVRRKFTGADLSAVQAGVTLWQSRILSLTRAASGGGLKVREVIPR